ncbi:MAG: adenylosuccinate synthetase [Clostridia bacterium]|nr:adenylosuccinate synthetase [Clostridia bacterium]
MFHRIECLCFFVCYGKFALHLLPSGIFREGVVNILGNGVTLDPENLWLEMQDVIGKGVALTPDNLKISERASLLLTWHRDPDTLESECCVYAEIILSPLYREIMGV